MSSSLLSELGSDRATAYNVSRKIARRGDQLYVTWLEHLKPRTPTRMLLAAGTPLAQRLED